jgi:hypothetical protein
MASDELIELELQRHGILVLRLLDDKDHEKSNDGGTSVDDQLPGVGIIEHRPAQSPYNDEQGSNNKGTRPACGTGHYAGDPIEDSGDAVFPFHNAFNFSQGVGPKKKVRTLVA